MYCQWDMMPSGGHVVVSRDLGLVVARDQWAPILKVWHLLHHALVHVRDIRLPHNPGCDACMGFLGPATSRLAVTDAVHRAVYVLDASTGIVEPGFLVPPFACPCPTALAVNPNGTLLAIASGTNVYVFRNKGPGKGWVSAGPVPVAAPCFSPKELRSMCFHHSDTFLAVLAGGGGKAGDETGIAVLDVGRKRAPQVLSTQCWADRSYPWQHRLVAAGERCLVTYNKHLSCQFLCGCKHDGQWAGAPVKHGVLFQLPGGLGMGAMVHDDKQGRFCLRAYPESADILRQLRVMSAARVAWMCAAFRAKACFAPRKASPRRQRYV